MNNRTYNRFHIGKGMIKIVFMTWVLLGTIVTGADTDGKIDPEKWIREAEEAYCRINNYSAIFHKQERINGKLLDGETIFLKFKKPLKLYMKWIQPPHKGRELIYVHGWNNNQMKAHEGGILGLVTMNLDPKSSIAMKGNRHPVTDSGIGHLIEIIGENIRRGIKSGKLGFIEQGEEKVYGRRTQKVELIFPKEETKAYYSYRVIINRDVERKIPVNIHIYDWDNQLVEKYGYEDLKLNPGLTDFDFDPKNPEYKF